MTPKDTGLQPQRTALAWVRTGLAVLVNAVVVLRAGIEAERPFILALGVVLLCAVAALVACGTWRARELTSRAERTAPHWMLIAATSGVVWIACIGGIASIVTTLPE
jgi:uncharacterized membrane protein YidH (DUF202 family)